MNRKMITLLVEDDHPLGDGIVLSLQREDTEILQAFSLEEARRRLTRRGGGGFVGCPSAERQRTGFLPRNTEKQPCAGDFC